MNNNLLSVRVIDEILSMITEEKRFAPGDKLPNEFELSEELGVSRATLREAVRVLASQGYLEIRRGKGTYVSDSKELEEDFMLPNLINTRVNVKDLYEMRLIFEPQAAYYAAKRATDAEIEQIARYCEENEVLMNNQDPKWNDTEQLFHNSIASGTHNKFFTSLLPMFNRAIHSGIILAQGDKKIAEDTLHDHRQIVDFLKSRNGEGARLAMHLHIINTMTTFGIAVE